MGLPVFTNTKVSPSTKVTGCWGRAKTVAPEITAMPSMAAQLKGGEDNTASMARAVIRPKLSLTGIVSV